MKTYVTVEFKYNNKNYLFYGETRNEVKTKIDTWMKDNKVTLRPYYTYKDYGTLLTNKMDVKEKVLEETHKNLWYDKYDTWENILFKNFVRFCGFVLTLLVVGVIFYEVRKYMLYPYFVDFVQNRPEDLMDGLNKVMDFGWDVLGVMILFYWKTEIILLISTIVGWFTPKMVEKYMFKMNMKKMKNYLDNLTII